MKYTLFGWICRLRGHCTLPRKRQADVPLGFLRCKLCGTLHRIYMV